MLQIRGILFYPKMALSTAERVMIEIRHRSTGEVLRVMQGDSLHDADLSRASLCGADLRGADLQGAILWQANLMHADLRGADLRGTVLLGAVLWGADLAGARYDAATRWPYGFAPSAAAEFTPAE